MSLPAQNTALSLSTNAIFRMFTLLLTITITLGMGIGIAHGEDDVAIASGQDAQTAMVSEQSHERPFTVGALAFSAPEVVYQRWAPTLARVSQATGIPLTLVPLTPDQLVARVANNELDFIIGNALITVAFKKDYGVSHLLTLVPHIRATPEHAIGSALIAKKDLNINSLNDLKPLGIISTDPNAFGGFQIIAGEMVEQGIAPLSDLKQLNFVGFPQDKLLNYILEDRADVAILPSCVLENAINRAAIPADKLHVLLPQVHSDFQCQVSSKLYPSYAFSKLGHTDHRVATQIVRELLTIDADDAEAITGRYQYWSAPVQDNHVFALLEHLDRWPFVTNWQRLVADMTPWAMLTGLVLLLGYLHHLRVKRLVVKRTQALSDEMAQHKNTQKTLFEQQKQFYRAQRVLLTGEMASGIAHELNQPLAGIRYLTQGCIYRLGDGHDELKSALTKAIQQVDRAQNTIKRFRQFCHQPSVLQDCDLQELIEDTLNLMQPDFNRIKLHPHLNLMPLTVSIDVSLMQQVIVNLLRNALDAMETIEQPKLSLLTCQTEQDAHIAITDNGIGLSEAALQRLFFPFETSKVHGLGLGMVVCKRIIEEHGGKIRAMNNHELNTSDAPWATPYPRGVTILVTLPLKAQTDV